jgi:hypothetical protein
MGRAARDIDHVMLIPRDLAHARSAYERMGFTVTPLTSHPQENGVPYERTSQAVRVLPDSAHGAVLEFTV